MHLLAILLLWLRVTRAVARGRPICACMLELMLLWLGTTG